MHLIRRPIPAIIMACKKESAGCQPDIPDGVKQTETEIALIRQWVMRKFRYITLLKFPAKTASNLEKYGMNKTDNHPMSE